MARFIPFLILGAGIACASGIAMAQENSFGPPEALQFPVQAGDSAPNAVTGPFLRAAVEQAADLGLCQALMQEDGFTFPDGFKDTDCTAAYADKVRNGDSLVHWRSSASRPLKCGDGCFGRPFMVQTQNVDRPNLREAMLYGHLDFEIDPPGPVDRDLTYFYEVHVQCKAPNGARTGNIEVRVEVGQPVLGEPGTLESTLDFLLLPVQISRRIDNFIQSKLQGVPNTVLGGAPCRSIGTSLGTTALFDAMPFDSPPTGHGIRGDVAGVLSDHARIEFLSITRKPLPPLVAPEFAEPGNPAAGYFTAYINGVTVPIPPPLGAPDGLVLPPAGGTVALNDCRTIPLGGSGRLQLLFVNGLGGAVWSQFPRSAKFGADAPRRMTTGRGIVLPPIGMSPKPTPMTLGEFELLYRIVYLPAPVVSVESAAGSTTSPVSPLHDVHGTATVLSDGSPPPTPCREI
jgi:hypothetical protein